MLPSDLEIPNSLLLANVLAVPINQHINITIKGLSYPTSSSPDSTAAAVATFPLAPHLLTSTKTLHGGITTLCLDTVCYLAVIPTLKPGESAVTVSSSFQLIGPITWDERVDQTDSDSKESLQLAELEGRVVKREGKMAFCESTVRLNGKIVAKGMLTKMISPGVRDSKI